MSDWSKILGEEDRVEADKCMIPELRISGLEKGISGLSHGR